MKTGTEQNIAGNLPLGSGLTKQQAKTIYQLGVGEETVVFELPTAQAEEHTVWIADDMTGAIKVDVPLKVDIRTGATWFTPEK